MSVRYDAKHKSWYFVIDLPRGDDGKRNQHFRRGFKTAKLAERAEEAARKQFGEASLSADGTVAAELSNWLEERELDVAKTTLSNYTNAIKAYINPHIGTRQLYDLDKKVINDMYRRLLKQGSRSGKPLSSDTVRHVHRLLMKALKDLGIVIEGVREPRRADKETYGRKGIWTAEQCRTFLLRATQDRLYAAWVLVVVCGMRRGEVAGLKWPKVDLGKGVVCVHWQRTAATGIVDGGVIEKEPKGKSKRPIAIGRALVAVLSDHAERQRKEKEDAGVLYRNGGYLFCNEDGTPYHPKTFTDRFRRLCVQAGVPVIAFHDGGTRRRRLGPITACRGTSCRSDSGTPRRR